MKVQINIRTLIGSIMSPVECSAGAVLHSGSPNPFDPLEPLRLSLIHVAPQTVSPTAEYLASFAAALDVEARRYVIDALKAANTSSPVDDLRVTMSRGYDAITINGGVPRGFTFTRSSTIRSEAVFQILLDLARKIR